MAKGNLFLGQARGKVGDVVFSRAYGKQITRSRASQVANPRTIGQNTQRCILATIAKAAAALTPIVDHSFVNVTYGAESVRHFRKLNMAMLRNLVLSSGGVNYNLSAKGAGFVPNDLKISEGNLPAFGFDSDAGENPAFAMSNTPLPSGEVAISVSDFKASYPYIQGGDQLTLVKVVNTSGTLVDGDATFAVQYDRIVFAPDAFADSSASIYDAGGTIDTSLLDMAKTTNADMLVPVNSGSGKWLGIPRDSSTNHDVYAVALILSRRVNNVWQRSTQYLHLCEFTDATDNDIAIDSYGATEAVAGATEYLNQATEGEQQQGISGPYVQLRSSTGVTSAQWGTRNNAGAIEMTDGAPFEIDVTAFGNADKILRHVEIEGDNVDGRMHLVGEVSGNSGTLKFAGLGDGNLVGTYTAVALFDTGWAYVDFSLRMGE